MNQSPHCSDPGCYSTPPASNMILIRVWRWPTGSTIGGMVIVPRIQRTELQQCLEPVANEPLCSMSESLAHGLVKRLSTESRAANRVTVQAAGIPVLPMKQAAAFRAACRWLDTTIPAALKIASVRIGDARGKHKDSLYGILHWLAREDARSLVASCLLIEARKLTPTYTDLLEVSGHALMRLFYRLKTTDAAIVLARTFGGRTRLQPMGAGPLSPAPRLRHPGAHSGRRPGRCR